MQIRKSGYNTIPRTRVPNTRYVPYSKPLRVNFEKMENKTAKFILKTIILFPIGFGFWTLTNGFDLNHWVIPVIAGFVGSFGIVFWQLFDYEKYDKIQYSDFLESKHSLVADTNSENWNEIDEMIKNPFVKLKVLEKTEDTLKVQIERKFIDSILYGK